MNKKLRVTVVFALVLAPGLVGTAAAAKYINLIGTWNGTWGYVSYNGSIYEFQSSTTADQVLVVTNQQGSLFYGTIWDQPMTGNITGNKISITSLAWGGFLMVDATIAGKTIKETTHYINAGNFIESGNFVCKR
jgi:hypothetical protein